MNSLRGGSYHIIWLVRRCTLTAHRQSTIAGNTALLYSNWLVGGRVSDAASKAVVTRSMRATNLTPMTLPKILNTTSTPTLSTPGVYAISVRLHAYNNQHIGKLLDMYSMDRRIIEYM